MKRKQNKKVTKSTLYVPSSSLQNLTKLLESILKVKRSDCWSWKQFTSLKIKKISYFEIFQSCIWHFFFYFRVIVLRGSMHYCLKLCVYWRMMVMWPGGMTGGCCLRYKHFIIYWYIKTECDVVTFCVDSENTCEVYLWFSSSLVWSFLACPYLTFAQIKRISELKYYNSLRYIVCF